MGKKKLFNEDQEKFILDNYEIMSNEAIANALGQEFNREQINSWLQHRGLKKNGNGIVYKNQIFSDRDVEFIKNNYSIMTCREIGQILGFTSAQIYGKVSKLDLPKKEAGD